MVEIASTNALQVVSLTEGVDLLDGLDGGKRDLILSNYGRLSLFRDSREGDGVTELHGPLLMNSFR